MNQFKFLLFAFFCLFTMTFQSCVQQENDENETISLVLKPDSRTGMDAVIWTERPDNSYPNHRDFQAMGWTWYSHGFDGGIRRSLINFNLSSIPADAKIEEATLSLFYNATSGEIPSTNGHSQRDGSNRSILYRITSPWTEDSVTWNNQPSISTTNNILVKASDSADEDYEIDVKNLIEDMVANPGGSFGFMYMLENEEYYRATIFASSDHEDSDLHPQLEVKYTSVSMENGN